MGRRLLVIVGVLIAASASGRLALGQDDGQAPPPPTPVPAPAPAPTEGEAQIPIPEDLKLPPAPAGSDADGPGVSRPTGEPTADEPTKDTAKPKSARSKTGRTQAKASDPPREIESGLDAILRAAPSGDADPLRIKTDANVVRTQGPAPAAAAAAQPGAPAESKGATADRLPIGKQSVAVTVDVQAPTTMNLNKEANLKLIVRNTGASDALNIEVHDELPEGLQYISSVPEMVCTAESHLSYKIATLQAGSDRVINVTVKPTRTGPKEHAATVRFETGCRSRTSVLKPELKVDVIANPTVGKVLKGQPVEFKVTVTNLGDGPARNISIQAKLSPGLRHDRGTKNDDPILYELTLPDLMPKQSEKLDTLVADAVIGGEQSCTVKAISPDVEFIKEDAEVTKTIAVVEPMLKLDVQGPDSRFTDTVADYEITLKNPGSAPARKIRLSATLPTHGKLVGKLPSDARYDATTRRLSWTIDQIEPNGKTLSFPFHVRVGGIGRYELLAQASGDSGLKDEQTKRTDVLGMPDVDLVVSESKRVLDMGGTTTFQIRLRNYGTKDATNIQVTATLSPNLEVQDAGGGSKDVKVAVTEKKDAVKFDQINKLGPGKEMVLGILVKVVGEQPKLATCKVVIAHDDLTDTFEDMAGVKVTSGRRAAGEATSKQ